MAPTSIQSKKLRSENESTARKLRVLGREKLSGIRPATNGKITLLKGIFENLTDDQLQEFAGEKIADANTVVLVANVGGETADIELARNENMGEIDCNKLFRQLAGADGRGGVKPHFVIGVIKKEAVGGILDRIAGEILR